MFRCARPRIWLIYKLIAARPRDLLDVEGVVRVQGRQLDIARVRFWIRKLSELLEVPDLIEPFEAALRKARRQTRP